MHLKNLNYRFVVHRTALTLIALLAGAQAMAIEQPKYMVVHRDGDVGYRQYQAYLVAETEVTDADDFDAAGNEGFRHLFRFIIGRNTDGTDITMTAPVIQDKSSGEKGTKIAMTAPVAQDASADGWRIAFMLPSKYTMETAPRPTDKRVYIRETPAKLVATSRYSGRWTTANNEHYKAELALSLTRAGVKATGEPMVARYDPPYILPFMRRNEISVPVDRLPANAE